MTQQIIIGSQTAPLLVLSDSEIVAGSTRLVQALSLIGEELSIDTLSVDVEYASDTSDAIDVASIAYGTPTWYEEDGRPVGKFYVTSVVRLASSVYRLNCESIIGLLDKKMCYGGLYEQTPFRVILEQILSGNLYKPYFRRLESVEIRSGGFQRIQGNYSAYAFNVEFEYLGLPEELLTGTETEAYLTICGPYRNFDVSFSTMEPRGNYCGLCAHVTKTNGVWSAPRLDIAWCNTRVQGPELTEGQRYRINIWAYPGIPSLIRPALRIYVNDVSYYDAQLQDGVEYSVVTQDLMIGSSVAYIGRSASNYQTITTLALPIRLYWIGTKYSDDADIVPAARIVDGVTGLAGTLSPELVTSRSGSDLSYSSAVIPWYALNFFYSSAEDEELISAISYDEEVAEYEISGWIPYGTKREALQQLMFASATNLIKDEGGNLIFTWLRDSIPRQLSDDEIYDNGKYNYEEAANRADVTEYRYYYEPTEDPVVLYDNTDGYEADTLTVTFRNAPIVKESLTTSLGLRLLAANENVAVVSGVGKLSGRPYQITRNIVERLADASVSGKTVTVSEATLISVKNSETVTDKVYEFYRHRKIIKNALLYSGQRCGERYILNDPFGEIAVGYLVKLSLSVSGITKATAEFVTGYTPVGTGGEYKHIDVLTGSGTWEVPAEVLADESRNVRIYLVGGGQGGESGYAGENGRSLSTRGESGTIPATEGGSRGANGSGGKILMVTIPHAEISASYAYACGLGGDGGGVCASHAENNPGAPGTPSVFGGLSSADGYEMDRGVINYLNGQRYGCRPTEVYGVDGGSSMTGSGSPSSRTFKFPVSGSVIDRSAMQRARLAGRPVRESDYEYKSGVSPAKASMRYIQAPGTEDAYDVTIPGSYPSGAAAGNPGADPRACGERSYAWVALAAGADGANATTPGLDADEVNSMHYGWGGYGGSGGGAGANSAEGRNIQNNRGVTLLNFAAAHGGTGGKGSAGGRGADGCIMVLW